MHIHKAAALFLTAALLIVPASAHGGHCRTTTSVPYCTTSGCTESGHHLHNGTMYYSTVQMVAPSNQTTTAAPSTATVTAPVTYSICAVEGCTIAGRHFHDGAPYCGAAHTGTVCDGTCLTHPLCGVDGCTLTGYHLHDGESYCGATHTGGYCNGTCQTPAAVPQVTAPAAPQVTAPAQSTQTVYYGGRHHGRHH